MTIEKILKKAYTKYKLSPLDAEIILSLAMGKSKEFILAHPEKELNALRLKKFISFAKRRCNGEPVAYITGKKEFFGLEFMVNKKVLIPRPETELLVELLLKKILDTKYNIPDNILDIGTGSGNIIISLAKNIPAKIKNKINFFAVDISKKPLSVAKENAVKHIINKKIKFVQSDLLNYFLKNKIKLKNIFIVANLPYVSSAIYKKNKNNLKFEPKQALVSNKKGLNHYMRLIREIKEINKKCCVLHVACCMEISPEQKTGISLIIRRLLPRAKINFFKDLAGKARAVLVDIDPI